ncbi:hypothetical protein [Actinomycetospora rhizophila]
MNVDDRCYSVQLHFAEARLVASLTMIPAQSKAGQGKDGLVALLKETAGPREAGQDPSIAVGARTTDLPNHQLRELMSFLVHEVVQPDRGEVLTDLGGVVEAIGGTSTTYFATLEPVHQEVVDYLLTAPVLPTEQSWAVVRNIAATIMTAGGIGAAALGIVSDSESQAAAGAAFTAAGTTVVAIKKEQPMQLPFVMSAGAAAPPPDDHDNLQRKIAEIQILPLTDPQKNQLIYQISERHYVGPQ